MVCECCYIEPGESDSVQYASRDDGNPDELSPSGAVSDADHDPLAKYSNVQPTVQRLKMVIYAIQRNISQVVSQVLYQTA